jgi:hypothetical protein
MVKRLRSGEDHSRGGAPDSAARQRGPPNGRYGILGALPGSLRPDTGELGFVGNEVAEVGG